MMEPSLVEECTFLRLVPSLEKVAVALGNADRHDLFVGLLIVIMNEEGFRLDQNVPRTVNENIDALKPETWKSARGECYELLFDHENELLRCKIVGVPIGDVLVIDLCPIMFTDGSVTKMRCAAFQTLKYVNPYSSDVAGRFMNLRELAHRFKDCLTTPIKGEILTNAGIMNASLAGLPAELKLLILSYLGIRDIFRISQSCREFRYLTAELQTERRRRQHPVETRDYYKKHYRMLSLCTWL